MHDNKDDLYMYKIKPRENFGKCLYDLITYSPSLTNIGWSPDKESTNDYVDYRLAAPLHSQGFSVNQAEKDNMKKLEKADRMASKR